jgi:hypothetical protein
MPRHGLLQSDTKAKIQAIDIKFFLGSAEGKTRKSNRNKIFREKVGIQNLLIESEEK